MEEGERAGGGRGGKREAREEVGGRGGRMGVCVVGVAWGNAREGVRGGGGGRTGSGSGDPWVNGCVIARVRGFWE